MKDKQKKQLFKNNYNNITFIQFSSFCFFFFLILNKQTTANEINLQILINKKKNVKKTFKLKRMMNVKKINYGQSFCAVTRAFRKALNFKSLFTIF